MNKLTTKNRISVALGRKTKEQAGKEREAKRRMKMEIEKAEKLVEETKRKLEVMRAMNEVMEMQDKVIKMQEMERRRRRKGK